MSDRESLRERVLWRAGDVFYAEGITATGVDRVAEVAEVSKRTLYKHFGSKDALVAAALAIRDAPLREQFTSAAAAAGDGPADQLRGLFAGLAERISDPDFRGCPYVNAVGELADRGHPAGAVAVAHKQALLTWIRERADAASVRYPDQLSAQLMIMFDGAMAQGAVLGDLFDAASLLAAVDVLIDDATWSRPRSSRERVRESSDRRSRKAEPQP